MSKTRLERFMAGVERYVESTKIEIIMLFFNLFFVLYNIYEGLFDGDIPQWGVFVRGLLAMLHFVFFLSGINRHVWKKRSTKSKKVLDKLHNEVLDKMAEIEYDFLHYSGQADEFK